MLVRVSNLTSANARVELLVLQKLLAVISGGCTASYGVLRLGRHRSLVQRKRERERKSLCGGLRKKMQQLGRVRKQRIIK